MDILFVSNWSAPNIVGANYASSGVQLELSKRKLYIGVLSSFVGHHPAENNTKDLILVFIAKQRSMGCPCYGQNILSDDL